MELVDFTNCERLPGRAYNGANGKKIAVRYDGDVWLLKFPPSAAEKPTTLSYSNSCFSEHLASNIANMLGLKSHETPYLSDLQRRFYKIYLAARCEAMFKSLLNNLGSCF